MLHGPIRVCLLHTSRPFAATIAQVDGIESIPAMANRFPQKGGRAPPVPLLARSPPGGVARPGRTIFRRLLRDLRNISRTKDESPPFALPQRNATAFPAFTPRLFFQNPRDPSRIFPDNAHFSRFQRLQTSCVGVLFHSVISSANNDAAVSHRMMMGSWPVCGSSGSPA